ncbi:NAD-dependent formate dehydrogenase beta subunit [Treponema primitia ZAS-2]|uniref:HndB3 n=1 Tax=Treponema primitia (strain ATCC BAA-887 / DSM 12427 / ZAS-2) TaxID=545694 RepID=F5YKB4_TREPZ|nr:NADH-ubiquinone oxidoreductase-F iron-sulfur binding region domain-containing protein [Treponema primitia]AEF84826.1 NAD-dependent formate dehydrogenase beta subunit [Treponema primitia ZAS-2]AEL20825.1 HndB3 [Treponema primitia ZAS-2]
MSKLTNRDALKKVRESYKKAFDAEKRKIFVCAGNGCIASGSIQVYDKLAEIIKSKNVGCSLELKEEPGHPAGLKKGGCPGFCNQSVLVLVEPEGWLYTKVKPEDAEDIVEQTIKNGKPVERLAYKAPDGKLILKKDEIPFYKKQQRIVLDHCGKINAESIKEYLAVEGYSAFEKVLFDMTPEAVCKEVTDSNLRGRGGAGFPAGQKWGDTLKAQGSPKYIVCNGDEGDPGAFMDQSVMEGIPHQMIEGMLIAARAIGAEQGYIYVRAEYPNAVARLRKAIEQAEEFGLLGDNILGTGFNFHLTIYRGAGAFVCGEGSALMGSIEGRRGMPRVKRYRSTERGLYEKPTVLNNVETYANVPLIINRGANWYKGIGPASSPGTKTFALTGKIENTGLIEVPMGTKLREIIFDIGGGIRDGKKFKAVQIGGPSGGCLTEADLDMPLDFDSVPKAGAIIGSGGLVVMDETNCMIEIARFFVDFTKRESCGKCTPCREGTLRMLEILERIVNGAGKDGDIETLGELAVTISQAALCGLGKTAPNPILSTLKRFRNEYEDHIYKHKCTAGECQKLKTLYIDPQNCAGCGACAKACPVGAISQQDKVLEGKKKAYYVLDEKKCIKCFACKEKCKFDAVKEEA